MRVNITSNKIPSNKIPSNKVSRSLPSDMMHWKQRFCGTLGGGYAKWGRMYHLNLITGKHQLNPNWKTFYKITDTDRLRNCSGLRQMMETQRLMTSLVAQMVKSLPTMQETWVQSLGREGLLEKEMATHSRILAWKIPWTEEPGRLQSMGLQRVRHDWATSLHSTLCNPNIDARPRKRHPWDRWESLKKIYKLVSVISWC